MSPTYRIDPGSAVAQALRESLLDERAGQVPMLEQLRELGDESTWFAVGLACAQQLGVTDAEEQMLIVRALVRGASLALKAAEVHRRRTEPFCPPT